jgi:hypothetical protein
MAAGVPDAERPADGVAVAGGTAGTGPVEGWAVTEPVAPGGSAWPRAAALRLPTPVRMTGTGAGPRASAARRREP